jgi:hypothetical protein
MVPWRTMFLSYFLLARAPSARPETAGGNGTLFIVEEHLRFHITTHAGQAGPSKHWDSQDCGYYFFVAVAYTRVNVCSSAITPGPSNAGLTSWHRYFYDWHRTQQETRSRSRSHSHMDLLGHAGSCCCKLKQGLLSDNYSYGRGQHCIHHLMPYV